MHRLVVVLTCLIATGTARADGVYITEAIGGTDVKGDLAQHVDSTFRIRLAIGARFGNWAVEGWAGADIGVDGQVDGPPVASSLGEYGLDLKRLFPVTKHIDVYLRGSASHAIADYGLSGYGGRGLGVGAGVQLKGKVPALGFLFWPLFFTNWGPKVTAAVFVDNGYDFYRLHENNDLDNPRAVDGGLTHFMVGWGVGTDF